MVIMDLKKKEWSYEELSENNKCCTDCKTTKTPLWRGGPAGPKTLCNACGIRYRKRRASMVGVNKGQERKRERAQSGTNLRKSLKVKLMALREEVLLQHSTTVVKKQLGEEEQAAFCLMALSSGFVFA